MKKYIDFFNHYTNHYIKIAKDDFQKLHMNRKIEHSKRVNKFSIEIAQKLGLDNNEIYLISIASLLHDIGRFEQFYKYNTYIDKISINHGLLGTEILKDEKILDESEKEEKEIILEIIKMHNYKEIPKDIPDNLYLYTSIIRDADKIDWIYAMVNIIPNLSKENQAVFYSNKEDKNYISKELVDLILNNKDIIRSDLHTVDELRVSALSWITSDIKCKPSLEIIKREKLIEKSYSLICDSEEKEIIFNYLRKNIDKNN